MPDRKFGISGYIKMGKTDNRSEKKGFFSSLRFKIGFFYALLATVNIIFFSVMIFENQTDLLLSNFKYHSRDLVNTVLGELTALPITAETDANYSRLVDILKSRGVDQFTIFDREGHILHELPEPSVKSGEVRSVSAELKRKSLELGST